MWHQTEIIVALYVLVTCGPMLASQPRPIKWFGAAIVVTLAAISVGVIWFGVRHLRSHQQASHPSTSDTDPMSVFDGP